MQTLNPSEVTFYKDQTDFFKGKSGVYLLLNEKKTVVNSPMINEQNN